MNAPEKVRPLIDEGDSLVVGLSGGPDSVFLLHQLLPAYKAGSIALAAAHLDHEWRPTSASDAVFCKELCEELGVPFVHDTASNLNFVPRQRGSQEDIGRQQRRYFFERVAKEVGANKIALAHHRQDQQETFLIRLVRGATLSGLCVMKPHDGMYIRPLLDIDKEDIVAYLDEHSIGYVVDPTNIEQQFLRNRIRATVLPALRACDERFDENFSHSIKHLQDADAFLAQLTAHTFDAIQENVTTDRTSDLASNLKINLKKFCELKPFMQRRVLMHWLIAAGVPFTPTTTFLQEMLRFLLSSRGGSHQVHEQWKLVKKQDTAHIVRD